MLRLKYLFPPPSLFTTIVWGGGGLESNLGSQLGSVIDPQGTWFHSVVI